jgi:hypothetical protein
MSFLPTWLYESWETEALAIKPAIPEMMRFLLKRIAARYLLQKLAPLNLHSVKITVLKSIQGGKISPFIAGNRIC